MPFNINESRDSMSLRDSSVALTDKQKEKYEARIKVLE